MELDSTTVVATGAFVAGMSGSFLLLAGGQLQEARPATVWGVANLLIALAMMLVLQGNDYDLAFLALMAAGALTWIAIARFNKRTVPLSYLVAGLASWVIISLGPWEFQFGTRSAIFLVIASGYFVACAAELWRERQEVLPGRWPLLALVAMYSLAVLLGAVMLSGLADPPPSLPVSVLAVVYVSAVAFTIGTAVFMVAITKERSAADQALTASKDSLTGLAGRGALLASGDLAMKRSLAMGRPVAIALFDLDHFKSINDTFGHRTGDAVLCRFAESAKASFPSDAPLGRVGGEEFVAVLEGAGRQTALNIAERVRTAFAAGCVWVDGKPVRATVSSGIAVIEPGDAVESLEELLHRADGALFAAKESGRDRVSLGKPLETGSEPNTEINRAF